MSCGQKLGISFKEAEKNELLGALGSQATGKPRNYPKTDMPSQRRTRDPHSGFGVTRIPMGSPKTVLSLAEGLGAVEAIGALTPTCATCGSVWEPWAVCFLSLGANGGDVPHSARLKIVKPSPICVNRCLQGTAGQWTSPSFLQGFCALSPTDCY